MTHNTQGGIALTKDEAIKALEAGKKLWHFYFDEDEWIKMDKEIIVFEDGNRQHASEFWAQRTISNWMNGWVVIDDESPLPASPDGTEDWRTELKKEWYGLRGSYVDFVKWIESRFQPLQQENERLNKVLSESIQTGEKAIERIGELEKQLAEAREALEQIKTIYDNVEDAAGVIAKKALSALK